MEDRKKTLELFIHFFDVLFMLKLIILLFLFCFFCFCFFYHKAQFVFLILNNGLKNYFTRSKCSFPKI